MNKDSLPEEFEMPSYEEVSNFAKENGYSGRINVSKFYQYYAKTGFMYKGLLMDWKKKMSDWAETEKASPVRTMKPMGKKEPVISIADLWKAVDSI